jgi:hypothetical protein
MTSRLDRLSQRQPINHKGHGGTMTYIFKQNVKRIKENQKQIAKQKASGDYKPFPYPEVGKSCCGKSDGHAINCKG